MPPLLIIFAKEPTPGQVKTRLMPPLSPEAAARVYQAFLMDILEEMSRLSGIRLALAYSPASAWNWFGKLAPGDAWLFPQVEGDLGERMARAFDRAFQAGYGPVLLRGSDTPDLPGALMLAAQEVLKTRRADVVLGPAMDGGYYLIGLRAAQPGLFRELAWSTPEVLAATRARAQNLGLVLHLLEPWPDIDSHADLLDFLSRPHPAPAPGWRTHRLARQLLADLKI
ncbi:MAG: glycosyltransferase [Deltaproteobacteria bacterium]|nr:glycosyltransferase [Deltaproteobacteria bacterium]